MITGSETPRETIAFFALIIGCYALSALCFAAAKRVLLALLSGGNLYASAAYALLYGACNGLMTITRGTLPLALFDFRSYGSLVGALLIPSFLLTATAPVAYAYLIAGYGARGAMAMSVGLAAAICAAALALRWKFIGRVRAAAA